MANKFGGKNIERFDTLLKDEGYSSKFINGSPVINLDKTERLARPNASAYNETMDFAMGLVSAQMLMVELKLRVNSPAKIKLKDLEDKIKYSKALLGSDIAISKDRVFIFKDGIVAQARNYISRLFRNKGNYKTFTVQEFVGEYMVL